MSPVLRAFAIIAGVLLVGFALTPLLIFAFGAPVDPARAGLFAVAVLAVVILVLVIGLRVSGRMRRAGRLSPPVDAIVLGVIALTGVLVFVTVGPLTQR